MGRELKRVPLNFEWPLNKPWRGFMNPYYAHRTNCPDCKGSGSTMASQRLSDLVGLLMLSGSDAISGRCHPYFESCGGLHYSQGQVPSQDMAELTSGLAGRKPSFMGHDSCDRWEATSKIIKAAGLKKSWGTCKTCGGDGDQWDSKENKIKAARWRQSEPPKGAGFQIWETVSEGSPISPVFKTADELAEWMATEGNGWSTDRGTSKAQWLKFINGPGWAPSMIMSPATGIQTGVQAVSTP